MEFPRHCHKPDGLFVSVSNQEQYDAVIDNGWTDQPPAHVEKAVEVRYQDAIAAPVDAADDTPPPPKRGRKAKD